MRGGPFRGGQGYEQFATLHAGASEFGGKAHFPAFLNMTLRFCKEPC